LGSVHRYLVELALLFMVGIGAARLVLLEWQKLRIEYRSYRHRKEKGSKRTATQSSEGHTKGVD